MHVCDVVTAVAGKAAVISAVRAVGHTYGSGNEGWRVQLRATRAQTMVGETAAAGDVAANEGPGSTKESTQTTAGGA